MRFHHSVPTPEGVVALVELGVARPSAREGQLARVTGVMPRFRHLLVLLATCLTFLGLILQATLLHAESAPLRKAAIGKASATSRGKRTQS